MRGVGKILEADSLAMAKPTRKTSRKMGQTCFRAHLEVPSQQIKRNALRLILLSIQCRNVYLQYRARDSLTLILFALYIDLVVPPLRMGPCAVIQHSPVGQS